MDKAILRMKRKSVMGKQLVEQHISKSQERLATLHQRQLEFYEKEQRLIEVG